MRVLHVSSGNLFGGIETLLLTLAQHRHECPSLEHHIALAFHGRTSRAMAATGVPVHVLGAVRASRPYSVLRARRRLRELLRLTRFDVVICHAPWPHAVFGPAVWKAGVPLVFWAHSDATGRHWLDWWASRTSPALAICNSRFTADSIATLFPSAPTVIVHCPVASEAEPQSGERGRVRRDLGVFDDSVVVLQVSRLEPWKGQMALVEALGLLKDRPNWVAWIVGYPQKPDELQFLTRLRSKAEVLGIRERIRFLETADSIRFIYSGADVFCQANARAEPFGITIAEAMLSGLPVITSALGGPLEFIDSDCGVLLPKSDPEAVAEALDRLILESTLRKRMGECGINKARQMFDPRAQLQRLASVLESVARPRPGETGALAPDVPGRS